jgi:hypothetical protein
MDVINNFQRVGAISNSQVGREFEEIALKYFSSQQIKLEVGYSFPIGVAENKKSHTFDLGCKNEKIIIECKSHKWTTGGNVPSAKITVWNEAMYYFHLAPKDYRKIFFILKDENIKKQLTLGEYYIRTYKHLIPDDVEILEYDIEGSTVNTLKDRNGVTV